MTLFFLVDDFFDFFYFLPECFLLFFILFICVILLLHSVSKNYKFPLIGPLSQWLSIFGLGLTGILIINNIDSSLGLFQTTLLINYAVNNIKLIIIFSTLLCILGSINFLKNELINDFEYIILLLLATFSMLLCISAFDMITLYLTLEIQGLVFYILVSIKKNTLYNTEAGLKYFILGSLAAIFLLYGFSIIYSLFGTINFMDISLLCAFPILNLTVYYGVLNGLFFIVLGFCFKLTVAPFHMWAPDVYEGAPSSISLYLSVVPKIVYTFILIRLFYFVFLHFFFAFETILVLMGSLSIIIGSFFGIRQNKLKRLFVYSSISHIGFIILGIALGSVVGIQNAYIYLMIYLLLTLNLWIFYISLRRQKTNTLNIYINDFNSLYITNPLLSLFFAINIFSLAGVPPLIGFWVKFLILSSLMENSLIIVTIVIAFVSGVSAFFYVRLVKILYYSVDLSPILSFKEISKENALILAYTFSILILFMLHPDLLILWVSKIVLCHF